MPEGLECPRCGPRPSVSSGAACDLCGGTLRPRGSTSSERQLLEEALAAPPEDARMMVPGRRPVTPLAAPRPAPVERPVPPPVPLPEALPPPSDDADAPEPPEPEPVPEALPEPEPKPWTEEPRVKTFLDSSGDTGDVPPPAPVAKPAPAPVAKAAPAPAPATPLKKSQSGSELLAQSFADDGPPGQPSAPTTTLKFERVLATPDAPADPGSDSADTAPGRVVKRRGLEKVPVLILGGAVLALALALVAGLGLVRRESPVARALRDARTQATPELELVALEREGVSLLPRADVQAIRARAQLARGNFDEAKRAVVEGEKDETASSEDKATLGATKGLVALHEGEIRTAAEALELAVSSPSRLYERDAAVLGALAQALLGLENSKEALRYARRAIEVDALDPRARLVVARALAADGELKEALAELELGSRERDLLLARGLLRARLGDAAGALTDIDLARGEATTRGDVAIARASALVLARDVAGARAEAEVARGLGGDPTEASRALARVALVRGRLEEADKLLSEALARPGSPQTQAALATERAFVLAALDRADDARALLEAHPVGAGDAAENARRDLALATVAFARAEYDKAADVALRAAGELAEPRAIAGGSVVCALGSRFVVPAAGLAARATALAARAKDRLGQPDAAKTLRSKALSLAPRAPDVLSDAALAAIRRGDLDDAISQLEAALALAPDVPELEAHLGSVCLARGKLDDARRHLEKALALGTQDPATTLDLARTLLAKGANDQALELLERARENGLDVTLYCEGRKAIARAQGKRAEVKSWLERIVAARPFDLDARLELASLHAQENPEAAAADYETILKLAPLSEDALRAWVDAGLRELAQGKTKPGVVEARLRAARARMPDDRQLRALSGRFLLEQGHVEEALAELDAALEGAPRRSPEALRDRAIARTRLGSALLPDAFRDAIAASDPGDRPDSILLEKLLALGRDRAERPHVLAGLEALAAAAPTSREVRLAWVRSLDDARDWKPLQSAAQQAAADFPDEKLFVDMKKRADQELAK